MKTFLTLLFVLLCAAVFGETIHVDSVVTLVTDSVAATDTAPAIPAWKTVFTFQNVLIMFAGLYEITARVYPTAKNWSALSLIYNIINMIIPNAKKDGGKHK